jgi:hypothetical protein
LVMALLYFCRGCILSFGVVVGAGVLLPDFTRVSLTRKMGSVEVF